MSVFVSNSVTLSYGDSPAVATVFTALFADDESYEIVRLVKERIDKAILETIVGYRNIYNIRIQSVTAAQRLFLYQFIQSDDQKVTINGSAHDVNLRDGQLMLDLLNGYIGNVTLTMEFEDRVLTTPPDPTREQGVTTSSAGYANTSTGTGTVVTLYYNYGKDGKDVTGRTFRVNRVDSYKADIVDKRFSYVDWNNGYVRLGYRLNFFVDFGNFGLGQTQDQLQEDRVWLKEFVLAPMKRIEVFGQYVGDVVNDFDEVRYSYIGNSIYGKTTALNFKQKSKSTNAPVTPESQFILDDADYGVLDTNVLG
jgi:hypothetical protein